MERYRVDDGDNVYDPVHKNSEAELEESLRKKKISRNNGTTIHPSDNTNLQEIGQETTVPPATVVDSNNIEDANKQVQTQKENSTSNIINPNNNDEECSDEIKGIIIVNVMGRLANDMFEAAFTRRMASELGCGWHVIYRTMWSPAFLAARTDVCLPNALARDNSRHHPDQTKRAILKIGTMDVNPKIDLYRALTYNSLEPKDGWNNTDDRANKVTSGWVESLGEKAFTINHMEYPLQDDSVDRLVSKLTDPSSPVQVLNLRAFFIHHDWMASWMDPISDWLHIDPSCCVTPPPSDNAIVIHVRDFSPDEGDKNNHLEVGVYRDIIHRYSNNNNNVTGDREIIVVCQPKSTKSELVQALVEEFGAEVRTGTDSIDAMCFLSRTRGMLILSTSSSFSEMGALLAEQNGGDVEVHYPTHTLDKPACTMKVPSWKYHLVEQSRVIDFDVDHERLKVVQS